MHGGYSIIDGRGNIFCNNKLSESKQFVKNRQLLEIRGIFLFLLFGCQETNVPTGFMLKCIN